ncbi:hypothetical protein [Pseudoclavibacter helvolus]|uniref:hypothetical protein n=1 Tax=Pseudoclavibacter helvolus TaxID=255205 RepID=UPI0035E5CB96
MSSTMLAESMFFDADPSTASDVVSAAALAGLAARVFAAVVALDRVLAAGAFAVVVLVAAGVAVAVLLRAVRVAGVLRFGSAEADSAAVVVEDADSVASLAASATFDAALVRVDAVVG